MEMMKSHRQKASTPVNVLLGVVFASMGVAANAQEELYSPYAERNFPTELLFGETHVHSALSGDAGGGGTKLMPRDVYRFARRRSSMIRANLQH